MRCEAGQATVEWTGLVLVVALVLGALPAIAIDVDGRSLGGFLAHRMVCAVKGGCRDGDAQLARAYGERDAALVRRLAPGVVYEPGERQLPVDYRRCRARRCAEAPGSRDADVHRTTAGERATVFVRLLRRGGRRYIQYWLYYPDSNTTLPGSEGMWRYSPLARAVSRVSKGDWDYPGYHRDDWEGYQLRVERNGDVYARATSHGHYQGCKRRSCRNRWTRPTGWTRVSRGSHAGHIPFVLRRGRPARPSYPGRHVRERTSTAEGLRLIPLERVRRRAYRPLDRDITPPWRKRVYSDPEDDGS